MGDLTIEAYYLNDTSIDGTAKFYDSANNLVSIVNYHNGIKDGISVNYYSNGIKRDSSFFVNGLINGYAFGYDFSGKLLYKENHYYGLQVGDRVAFSSGKMTDYLFSSFDKNDIVVCKYDSLGVCRLVSFNSSPILTEMGNEEKKIVLGLFLYLPKPPNLTIINKIGLRNENKQTKNEKLIADNRLFLDTILNLPEKGWHYYISTHIESKKDSINKTYIQTLKNW